MLNQKFLLWTFCIDRGFACECLVEVYKEYIYLTFSTNLTTSKKKFFKLVYNICLRSLLSQHRDFHNFTKWQIKNWSGSISFFFFVKIYTITLEEFPVFSFFFQFWCTFILKHCKTFNW